MHTRWDPTWRWSTRSCTDLSFSQETKRNEIILYEDDMKALSLLLQAFSHPIGPSEDLLSHFFRSCLRCHVHTTAWPQAQSCYSNLAWRVGDGWSFDLARHLYCITNKYDMPDLHGTVVWIMAVMWNFGTEPGCISMGHQSIQAFQDLLYDPMKEHFSGYPQDLWPLFTEAMVHIQKAGPGDSWFVDKLSENPAMAVHVSQQLSRRLRSAIGVVKERDSQVKVLKDRLRKQEDKVKAFCDSWSEKE